MVPHPRDTHTRPRTAFTSLTLLSLTYQRVEASIDLQYGKFAIPIKVGNSNVKGNVDLFYILGRKLHNTVYIYNFFFNNQILRPITTSLLVFRNAIFCSQ